MNRDRWRNTPRLGWGDHSPFPPGEGYEVAVPLMACVWVIVACLVLDVAPLIWWWWIEEK